MPALVLKSVLKSKSLPAFYQTRPSNARIMITTVSWLAAKSQAVDTVMTFRAGSNTLGFAKYFASRVQNPSRICNVSWMPYTWNAGSSSEICAETPVASGILPNQTTKCWSYANPSHLTGCQNRDSGHCTGSTFRAGSNTLLNTLLSELGKTMAAPRWLRFPPLHLMYIAVWKPPWWIILTSWRRKK